MRIHAWMCRGQGKWRQTKPEGDRAGPEGGRARSREQGGDKGESGPLVRERAGKSGPQEKNR
jgi:hypothetical protein